MSSKFFNDPRNLPFSIDEYPGLREHWSRVYLEATVFSVLLFGTLGYLVYFEFLKFSETKIARVILDYCSKCLVRFEDMNQYDGVSGEVYCAIILAFIVYFFVYTTRFLRVFLYFKAVNDCIQRLGKRAIKGLSLVVFLFIGGCYLFFLLDIGILQKEFTGNAVFFVGGWFPVLVGLGAPFLCLFAVNIMIFFIKIAIQRGDFLDD